MKQYQFIADHAERHGISALCRFFSVSRSGYYDWKQAKPVALQAWRATLDQRVSDCFAEFEQRYGAVRIHRELRDTHGWSYNLKTVENSMKRQGLVAKAAKKFKATTNSKHNLPVADNLLKQDFTANKPNEKWCQDITYLWTNEGWLYLAVVIDLFSRQVVGWSMSERMTATLVCDALNMALFRRRFPKGVIVHSDRGSQYCSHVFQDLLKTNKLRCSMSAKGNCYDNACVESFFHSLKVEAVHGETFTTREAMRQTVFGYIETFYNTRRRHSNNDYVSPMQFEDDFYQKLAS